MILGLKMLASWADQWSDGYKFTYIYAEMSCYSCLSWIQQRQKEKIEKIANQQDRNYRQQSCLIWTRPKNMIADAW